MELNPNQRDALKEMINISFGRSVASLADFLGVFIQMNVPDVQLVKAEDMSRFLEDFFGPSAEIHLVQQTFHGEFFGEAVLALSAYSSASLVKTLTRQSGFSPEITGDRLELEVLLEVANIVMGSCLGRFAELLNTSLAFDPPELFLHRLEICKFRERVTTKKDDALLIHTQFQLDDSEAQGYIFAFLSTECLLWLLSSVDDFLKDLLGDA